MRVVSVIADAVVTLLRYLEERPPVSVFFIPVLSIAIEVACAAVLVIAISLRHVMLAGGCDIGVSTRSPGSAEAPSSSDRGSLSLNRRSVTESRRERP